ncbi:MAG: VWA domain-containing protein [Sandaracinus sp.]|nr:VWA domain-containing protein [Sandaracinus sp.]
MPSKRPTFASRLTRFLLAGALLGSVACGSGGDASGVVDPASATRLAPGGSQDFGLFRDLVERGEVPGPDTLEATGFFAEHAIGTPEAACDDAVCTSASLGVLRNLMDERTCTVVRVGFATPRTAAEARPAHLVLLAQATGELATAEAALDGVFAGLRGGDTVSLVGFDSRATTLVTETASLPEARAALLDHVSDGGLDLYAGLRAAYALAATTGEAREARVLVLTAGRTSQGITSPTRIVELVRSYAREGVATSVFGYGNDADAALWSRLAGSGAGNAFFAADADDVREILREELATSFTPIARDVRVRLDAGNAWDVVGLYGVTDARLDTEAGIASLPSLFLAGRRDGGSVMGPGMGRRGGGGALLFELMPRERFSGADLRSVGDVSVEFVDPSTGETVVQRSTVSTPFDATAIPEDGFVGDASVDKAFVVLNVFVAFKTMTLAVQEGDYAEAIVLGRALEPNLVTWLQANPDTDVEDDLSILRALLSNVERDAPADTDVSQAQPTPRWAYD